MYELIDRAIAEVFSTQPTVATIEDNSFTDAFLDAFESCAHGMYYSEPDIFKAVLLHEVPELGTSGSKLLSVNMSSGRFDQGLKFMRNQEAGGVKLLLAEGRIGPWKENLYPHSFAMVVDFLAQTFFFHDPTGKLPPPDLQQAIARHFESFKIDVADMALQPKENYACALYTLSILAAEAYGEDLGFVTPERLLKVRKKHIPTVLNAVHARCSKNVADLTKSGPISQTDANLAIISAIENYDSNALLPTRYAFVTTLIRLNNGEPFKPHATDIYIPSYDWHTPRSGHRVRLKTATTVYEPTRDSLRTESPTTHFDIAS